MLASALGGSASSVKETGMEAAAPSRRAGVTAGSAGVDPHGTCSSGYLDLKQAHHAGKATP